MPQRRAALPPIHHAPSPCRRYTTLPRPAAKTAAARHGRAGGVRPTPGPHLNPGPRKLLSHPAPPHPARRQIASFSPPQPTLPPPHPQPPQPNPAQSSPTQPSLTQPSPQPNEIKYNPTQSTPTSPTPVRTPLHPTTTHLIPLYPTHPHQIALHIAHRAAPHCIELPPIPPHYTAPRHTSLNPTISHPSPSQR